MQFILNFDDDAQFEELVKAVTDRRGWLPTIANPARESESDPVSVTNPKSREEAFREAVVQFLQDELLSVRIAAHSATRPRVDDVKLKLGGK